MGIPANDMVWLPIQRPIAVGNSLSGEVVYADHFGNLVTNVPGDLLTDNGKVEVQIADRTIYGLSETFHGDHADTSDTTNLIALVGSLGYLEIAVPDGNAAAALGAGPGAAVSVDFS